jgi:hypothetical protein
MLYDTGSFRQTSSTASVIALRAECHANSPLGSFGATQRWQARNFPGRIYCALKISTRVPKLFIILVAGAGFEPATFGL